MRAGQERHVVVVVVVVVRGTFHALRQQPCHLGCACYGPACCLLTSLALQVATVCRVQQLIASCSSMVSLCCRKGSTFSTCGAQEVVLQYYKGLVTCLQSLATQHTQAKSAIQQLTVARCTDCWNKSHFHMSHGTCSEVFTCWCRLPSGLWGHHLEMLQHLCSCVQDMSTL